MTRDGKYNLIELYQPYDLFSIDAPLPTGISYLSPGITVTNAKHPNRKIAMGQHRLSVSFFIF